MHACFTTPQQTNLWYSQFLFLIIAQFAKPVKDKMFFSPEDLFKKKSYNYI